MVEDLSANTAGCAVHLPAIGFSFEAVATMPREPGTAKAISNLKVQRPHNPSDTFYVMNGAATDSGGIIYSTVPQHSAHVLIVGS